MVSNISTGMLTSLIHSCCSLTKLLSNRLGVAFSGAAPTMFSEIWCKVRCGWTWLELLHWRHSQNYTQMSGFILDIKSKGKARPNLGFYELTSENLNEDRFEMEKRCSNPSLVWRLLPSVCVYCCRPLCLFYVCVIPMWERHGTERVHLICRCLSAVVLNCSSITVFRVPHAVHGAETFEYKWQSVSFFCSSE